MIEVENHSGVPHQLFEKQGAEGEPLDVLVLRASFDMVQHGEPIVPSAVQSPMSFGDSFAGPSQPHLLRSVLAEEGDLVVFKPGTDVLVSGTATAPSGQAREHWLARLSLGTVQKTLKLHGPRRLRRSVLGWKLGAAASVSQVVLDDRLAYGGCFDATSAGDVQTAHHPENAAGTGWLPDAASLDALTRNARKLIEQQVLALDAIAAPQIEHPLHPLQAPGAAGLHWNLTPRPRWSASRLALQGRMDDAWLAHRHPLLPEDFDPRFFQSAAPDQVITPWLQGDETLRLEGLLAQPRCEMRLPGWRMLAVPRLASGFEYVTLPVLDTVRIDLTQQRITLLWRAHFRRDDPLLGLTLGVTDRPVESSTPPQSGEATGSGAQV